MTLLIRVIRHRKTRFTLKEVVRSLSHFPTLLLQDRLLYQEVMSELGKLGITEMNIDETGVDVEGHIVNKTTDSDDDYI